ncbi:HEPN domain-containing protein [uncultured Methanobrevibacter sp.]|uniref:HEPN domain-containing protein n=1 Tax=uncultured Methanobrevibacter sp. TaxID=253161 RepID=UPI0025F22551|nr:HEPN domain-containing protein [uncultured Methanobrevibacter sp.]
MGNVREAFNVGKEQLISSKMLFEGGQYRDSVTLSYYAMYSSALALLLKKDIFPKTHEGTLRQLAKEYVKEGLLSKESYDYLYDGRTLRNKSSYDYSTVFSEELAEELILQAETFIDEVIMIFSIYFCWNSW